MAGFRRFREKYFESESVYNRLSTSGQTPKTLLIGCSDSRVDPAILTDASPGELFVVRNVANLVPPCEPARSGFHGTSSAIEFAVENLKVENVIVLGHRQCGGIRALMETDGKGESFVAKWMTIAGEAKKNVLAKYPDAKGDELLRLAEMESVKVSVGNFMTFPFVQTAIKTRAMVVLGLYFDLERGELLEYHPDTDDFMALEI